MSSNSNHYNGARTGLPCVLLHAAVSKLLMALAVRPASLLQAGEDVIQGRFPHLNDAVQAFEAQRPRFGILPGLPDHEWHQLRSVSGNLREVWQSCWFRQCGAGDEIPPRL